MSALVIRFLLLAAALFTSCGAAPAKLTLSVTDSNDQSFGAVIVFDGQFAFEYGDKMEGAPLATYDLATPGWTEANGQKISLEQAKSWAAASKQRAMSSLGRLTDPGQKAFTEMLLDPTFKITAGENQIQLDSTYLDYTVSEPGVIEPGLQQAFFAYDELNAYRKAMVRRGAPPFTQLAVTQILKDRAMLPGRIVMELRTPGGEVRVVTDLHWSSLTAEEFAALPPPRS